MKKISKLHFITTSAIIAEQACKGGVDWVQLRLKNVSYNEYFSEALKVQEVCKRYGATLIINDNAQVAIDIKADGVHLGKTDSITNEQLQQLISGKFILGRTTNTLNDILALQNEYVSYVGLGPLRFTTTKQNLSPIIGLEGYHDIIKALKNSYPNHPPIIGIGGIEIADVAQLMHTGIHGIALSGAIGNANNIEVAAQQFVAATTTKY